MSGLLDTIGWRMLVKTILLALVLATGAASADARYLHMAEVPPRLERHTAWLTTYKSLGYPVRLCKVEWCGPVTEPPPSGIWPNSGWACRRWSNTEIHCRIIVNRGVEAVTAHWVEVRITRRGRIVDGNWFNEKRR